MLENCCRIPFLEAKKKPLSELLKADLQHSG